ncbi:ABC transporter permease [Mycobacterium sp. 21AC1]|uniref:ABC transporter permease n=1 Tax=[Mycobacterium] appelbergii TaxID=2939269 RepID=UPI002938F7D2|nr:ABC transporter permease [Mycobacterium sp. 21AC1]MDV3126152.1 ABC transporter permease [Mycobacterium sp. 21AC1]
MRADRNIGLLVVLVALFVVGSVTSTEFLQFSNVVTILTLASVIGVVSVGATFVIIGGGIDLSVGSVLGLASVWATTVATQAYGPWVMVMTSLIVGTVCGLVNGVLIAYGGLVPFIVTLAMLVGAQGLAELISNRQSQLLSQPALSDVLFHRLFGLPVLVYIFAIVADLGWILLNRTNFGARTVAVGSNAEAARLAGINVQRHTLLLYVLSGFCVGIAAIMVVAQTNTGASTLGSLYELDAIAAIIVGGTLLSGGRGTIVGTVLGVLVFTTITDLFILNGLDSPIQKIAKGAIIVAAVLFQRRTQKAKR